MAFNLSARLDMDATSFKSGAEQAATALSSVDRAAQQASTKTEQLSAAQQRGATATRQAAEAATQLTNAVNATSASTEGLAADTIQMGQGFEQLRRQLDPSIDALERLKAQQLLVQQSLKAGVTSQAEATRIMDIATNRYNLVASSVGKVANQNTAAAAAARKMGSQVQQAGYQFGDFAVQVASGSNIIVAATQQGAQLLSVFGGPWGAVVGAAAAIMGALYLGLSRAASAAGDLAYASEEYLEVLDAADELTAKATLTAQEYALVMQKETREKLASARATAEMQSAELQLSIQRQQERASSGGQGRLAAQRRLVALEAELTKVRDEIDRLDAAATNLGTDGLDRTTSGFERLEARLNPLAGLTREYTTDLATLDDRLKRHLITVEQHGTLVGALKEEYAEARQALLEQGDAVEATSDNVLRAISRTRDELDELAKVIVETPYDELIEDLTAERDLMLLSSEARKVEIELRQAEAKLKREGIELGEEQRDQIRQLIIEREKLAEAERQNEENLKELNRQAEKATDEIVNFAAEAFTDVFSDTSDGWRGLMDDMLTVARRTFAQIAAEAIIRPIIQPIVQGVVGGSGSSAGNGQNIIGQVTSVGTDVFDLFTGGGPNLSGIGTQIDTFLGLGGTGGGQALNAGVASVPGGLTNAAQPGWFARAGQGFNVLSTAAGFAGSWLAGKLFGGGTGTSIGSTIGSLAGTAIASGSTAIATALGAAAGPLGAVAGALLGGAIGGLLDKEPSNMEGNAIYDPITGGVVVGGQEGDKYSQGNRDFSEQLVGGIGAIGEYLEALAGRSLGLSVRGGLGDRDGLYAEFGEGAYNWEFGYGNDTRRYFDRSEAGIGELTKYVVDEFVAQLGEDLPPAVRTALEHVDWAGDIQQALSDIEFAANFGDIYGRNVETIGQYEQALNVLNAAADEARRTAERLGLALEEVDRQTEDYRLSIINDFRSGLTNEPLLARNPGLADINNLKARYTALLQEAEALGIAREEVDTWYRQMRELMQDETDTRADLAEQMADDLRLKQDEVAALENSIEVRQRLINQLRLQDQALLLDQNLSPLTGADRLAEAEALLDDAYQRALSGDTDAIDEFMDLRRSFLEISRDYNSVSDAYLQDFDETAEMSRQLQLLGRSQISVEQQALDEARAQTIILAQILAGASNDNTGGLGANPELNSLIRLTSGFAGPFGGGAFDDYVAAATANSSQDFGQREAINRTLAVISNYTGDFRDGRWQNYIASSAATETERAAARLYLMSIGDVPGFADGGMHAGGLRIVGERGPELELTGASRIVPNHQLGDIIGANDNTAVIASLDAIASILRDGFSAVVVSIEGLRSDLRSPAMTSRRTRRGQEYRSAV